MKCMYNQSKRGLPSDVRTMALKDYWLAEVDT